MEFQHRCRQACPIAALMASGKTQARDQAGPAQAVESNQLGDSVAELTDDCLSISPWVRCRHHYIRYRHGP